MKPELSIILKQFNLFFNYTLFKKKIICSKIIITSLIAVSIITILNSSNLFTDQIVYAQTVIDTLKVGNDPSAIAFNNLTGKMYVSNRHDDSISVINTNNRTDINQIPNIGDTPIDLAFDSFHNYLYVISGLEPIVTVINVSNNSTVDRINITSNSKGIIFDPKHKKMFTLPSQQNGTVKMIDTSTREVQDFFKVSGWPSAIGFDSLKDNLYISSQSASSGNGIITIINTSNKTIFEPISIGPSSNRNNFEFDPIHGHMYMTSAHRGKLYVIDANTRTIIDTFSSTSGLDFPLRMDLDKLSGKMYIANAGSFVFIIDTNDRSKHTNFPNRGEPVDIAFDTIHRHVYVVNQEKDSVTVIKPEFQIKDIAEQADNFGSAVATGDFNKDGYKDLAIGVRGEDIKITTTSPNIVDAGAVNVIYGSSSGPNFLNNQIWYQGNNGILDAPEISDFFGDALAAGDFNKDGADDLAIGVPGEDVGSIGDAGVVNIIYGSTSGLVNTGNKIWYQGNNGIADAPEKEDNFGDALAAGDFNKTGYDDLAIGVPREDVGSIVDAGVVNIIYGSTSGLVNTGNQIWYQGKYQGNNAITDAPEPADIFGSALAAGNFGKDGADDLAIGVLREDVGSIGDAGVVNIIYGSTSGLVTIGNQMWYQNNDLPATPTGTGIKDPSETGDRFGSALAAGNFNNNPIDDLAIGVPGEDVKITTTSPNIVDAGMINVIYGTSSGLLKAGNQIWYQNNIITDVPEIDDGFGSALAAGNFGKESVDDLAIGVPGENIESSTTTPAIIDAGVINVIYGSNSINGLVTTGNQIWYQGYHKTLDSAEPLDRFSQGDRFGSALAAGDFKKDGAEDIAIGVLGEDLETVTETQICIKADVGAVNVIYGLSSGLNPKNNQFWHQDQLEEIGFMYVVNQHTESVTVLNTISNTVVGSPIPVGKNPVAIAFDPVHNRMYVANEFSNTISVINITTNTVVGPPIPDGRNNPLAIAFDPVHNRMYVANELINTVLVIDTTTNTVVGSISVGNSHQGIAFDPGT